MDYGLVGWAWQQNNWAGYKIGIIISIPHRVRHVLTGLLCHIGKGQNRHIQTNNTHIASSEVLVAFYHKMLTFIKYKTVENVSFILIFVLLQKPPFQTSQK